MALRCFYKNSLRLRRLVRRLKNAAVAGGARFALALLGRLSLERALQVGEKTGALLYRLLRGSRRLALEHLRLAFGDQLSPTARAHLARASFINIARSFCEVAKIDDIRARREEYFEVEGWEAAEWALAGETGAVAVTGHIGNWEMLAAYFAWRGLKVAAIARRIYVPQLNRLLVEFRSRQGVETILRESPNSARQILRALKSKAILAMLIDQDTHAPSISVPFFGRMARTPAAAAALAVRRELPAVVMFIQRRPQGGHRITIDPPIVIERSDNLQADIHSLTRKFNEALERQIRRNPAEWAWWHRRWRRAPVTPVDLDAASASPSKNSADHRGRHSRESGNPVLSRLSGPPLSRG
jgi:KDO2-lipid IV(A) lauroyltransferase